MKVCKIVDEYRGDAAIAYLFYFEKSGVYSIELSGELSAREAPIFFDSFIERGVYTVDQHFSRRWVESRIVPRDRQNLGMILRENGLNEYDPFRLLMLAEGRCSQDDCAVFPVREAALPKWVLDRRAEKVSFVKPLGNWELLIIYNDGSIWRTDAEELLDANRRTRYILARPDKQKDARIVPGGDGVEWSDGVFLTAAELRGRGTKIPLSEEELEAVIKSYVVDTSDICCELDCSRQYVSKLVRENGLEEFKATGGSRLFARRELDRIRE